MSSTDIVGYTFQAANHCASCIREWAVHTGGFDPAATTPLEIMLDELAVKAGIDRYEERSFDSGDFPKVIFDSQVEDTDERCEDCGEPLIDVR